MPGGRGKNWWDKTGKNDEQSNKNDEQHNKNGQTYALK